MSYPGLGQFKSKVLSEGVYVSLLHVALRMEYGARKRLNPKGMPMFVPGSEITLREI